MKVSKIGNIMLFLGILSVMVVCAGAGPAQAKSLDVSVTFNQTSVTSGGTVQVTVKITNNGNSPQRIKRWFITYVVPNLVYKGPYDIQGQTVQLEGGDPFAEPPTTGQSVEKTYSLRISGAKGVAVPVIAFIQGEESWLEYDWDWNPTLKWKLDAVWTGMGMIMVN